MATTLNPVVAAGEFGCMACFGVSNETKVEIGDRGVATCSTTVGNTLGTAPAHFGCVEVSNSTEFKACSTNAWDGTYAFNDTVTATTGLGTLVTHD